MFLTRSSRPILSLKCRQRLFAQTCYASTTYSDRFKLVSLRSISADELGHPILNKKERCGVKTTTDVTSFAIKCAKICSLASSIVAIPVMSLLTSSLSENAAERPSVMILAIVANVSLGLFALTPLLLHSLTRRFVYDIYYNEKTGVFTSVHYNFIIQKRALRFRSEDVVLPEHSEIARKMWIPLATCFVDKHPLLLLLDENQYSDKKAFKILTANLLCENDSDDSST